MAVDYSKLFSSKKRTTPELNLKPEQRIVLSSDFNLFYKPEEEPLPAGLQEFTTAMDNFVNDAGTGLVIASEKKQKKEESAKAIEDHAKLKMKFRDAVKSGKITEQANPYYIEKFKQLSLNEYSTEFIDRVNKRYGELGVINDITEGAFTKFYKKELDKFITEKQLDFFEATELEQGFFKETSAQRAILENNHRQSQLKLFKDKFDDKLGSRVYGIISGFKDIDQNPLWNDKDDKFVLLAEKLQKEITEYYDLTGDGRDAVDLIIKGLEEYVTTTRDYDYAKAIIANLPSLLKSGTDTIEKIGRVEKVQEELLTLLTQAQEEKEGLDVKLADTQAKKEYVEEYQFLQNQEDTFDLWEHRSTLENENQLRAFDTFMLDQKFNGGKSNNPQTEREILKLLENGEFDEAEKYAQQEYHAGNITKQFYTSLITSDIANFRAFKDKPVFGNLEYKGIIDALKVEMASGKNAGNRIEASQANTYIQTRMMKWYRLYHNHKDYILEDGSFDDLKFEDDFLNYFRNMLTILRSTKGSNGDLLFPSLEWAGMKETKTITSILDKKMGELNK